jgi:hypothetical protein
MLLTSFDITDEKGGESPIFHAGRESESYWRKYTDGTDYTCSCDEPSIELSGLNDSVSQIDQRCEEHTADIGYRSTNTTRTWCTFVVGAVQTVI